MCRSLANGYAYVCMRHLNWLSCEVNIQAPQMNLNTSHKSTKSYNHLSPFDKAYFFPFFFFLNLIHSFLHLFSIFSFIFAFLSVSFLSHFFSHYSLIWFFLLFFFILSFPSLSLSLSLSLLLLIIFSFFHSFPSVSFLYLCCYSLIWLVFPLSFFIHFLLSLFCISVVTL